MRSQNELCFINTQVNIEYFYLAPMIMGFLIIFIFFNFSGRINLLEVILDIYLFRKVKENRNKVIAIRFLFILSILWFVTLPFVSTYLVEIC